MKKLTVLSVFTFIYFCSNAQQLPRVNRFADLSATFGSEQGTVAASYVHNWRTGKNRKFEIGAGARWTLYYGEKKDFVTAGPASLTRSFTFPFLIVFAGQKTENLDTLTVQRPLVNMINLSFNMGYHITPKLYGGINIDVIGFSFGQKSGAILTSDGNTQTEPEATPASLNLLLTGDHDRGNLNSEFFLKYQVGRRIGIKAVYQFIFIEYQTNNIIQVAPDGTEVDRFRNKANNFGLGISYRFN
jgi:hypothetical protein